MTLEIFLVFLRISLLSFGGVFGVLPELERMVVVEQGWLTSEKFLQAYVIGQFVPGPNMAMCPLIGWWIHGWEGFAAAFAGIYSGPMAVMTVAYALYHRNRGIAWVQKMERGVRPVVLGLLGSSVLRVWWLQTTEESPLWRVLGALLVAGGFVLVKNGRVSGLTVIVLAGVVWTGLMAAN